MSGTSPSDHDNFESRASIHCQNDLREHEIGVGDRIAVSRKLRAVNFQRDLVQSVCIHRRGIHSSVLCGQNIDAVFVLIRTADGRNRRRSRRRGENGEILFTILILLIKKLMI